MFGVVNKFWASLVALIALMIVLERSGGASRILGSAGGFVRTTVRSFK